MKRFGMIVAGLAVFATAACSAPPAVDALRDTANNMNKIRSGELSFRLSVADAGEGKAGFELVGPFSFDDGRTLPVAQIRYAETGGKQRIESTFISDGNEAYLVNGDDAFRLPPESVAGLKRGGSKQSLPELQIGGWIRDAKVAGEQSMDGKTVTHVTANLDPVAALNDLFAMAREVGAAPDGLGPFEGDDAGLIRRSVRSATMDLWTGKDDRLLRRLLIEMRFAADATPDLANALGRYAGASLSLELAIERPNGTVTVTPPANALPLPAATTG